MGSAPSGVVLWREPIYHVTFNGAGMILMAIGRGLLHEKTGARVAAAALVPAAIAIIHAVPNDMPVAGQLAVLLALVAFSGFLGGLWIGLAAAAMQLAYSFWLLSGAGAAVGAVRLFDLAQSQHSGGTLLTYLVAAPTIAIAAGWCRHRLESSRRVTTAQERLANTIFEQAGVAIAYADLNGCILRCNRMYSEIVGRTQDEVIGMNFKELVDPRDRDENWTLSRQLLAGVTDKFTLVNRYIRKDGESVWSRKVVNLIRTEAGQPSHLLLFATDISDEMALRAELEQSEANYRALWESSGNANFLLFAPDFRIEQENQAAVRLFGVWDRPDLSTLGLADLSPERQDDGELSVDKERRLLAGALRDGTATFEWLFRSPDGAEAYATVNVTRVKSLGRVGLQCSAVDITDRVLLSRHQADARRLLAEEVNTRTAELEDVTYELHLAQSLGGMGSFSLDLVSGTFSCSPETARILNLDAFDRIPIPEWTARVHPSDLQAVQRAWEKAVGGAPFDVTYRVVLPEGVRHVKAGARFKRDSDGNPTSAIGALLDLTSLVANRDQSVLRAYRGRVDGLLAATAAVQADAEQKIETDTRRLADSLLEQFPDWSAEEIDAVIAQAIATIKMPSA